MYFKLVHNKSQTRVCNNYFNCLIKNHLQIFDLVRGRSPLTNFFIKKWIRKHKYVLLQIVFSKEGDGISLQYIIN